MVDRIFYRCQVLLLAVKLFCYLLGLLLGCCNFSKLFPELFLFLHNVFDDLFDILLKRLKAFLKVDEHILFLVVDVDLDVDLLVLFDELLGLFHISLLYLHQVDLVLLFQKGLLLSLDLLVVLLLLLKGLSVGLQPVKQKLMFLNLLFKLHDVFLEIVVLTR